jgi:opacity protein-like surface antigen
MFRVTTVNVRRRKAMQKLFLMALVVGVCAPTIMAQDPANAGVYGGVQNLRFNALETSKPDVSSLPQTSKSAPLLTDTPETGKQYGASLPFNSPSADVAGGRGQCRGCPIGHTHVEIYGGYSFLLFDGFATDNVDINDVLNNRIHFHGVDLSGTFNFSRYVGAQVDFSLHRRSEDLAEFGLTGDADVNIQNYLFGVQVKNNSKEGGWFRPFGHFLAGVSRQKLEFNSPLLIPVVGDDAFSFRRNSFALAMGGGVDFRITDVFSIRAIKLDYLPVFVDDFAAVGVTFDGRTQRNFRAGAGLAFHF